MTSFLSFFLEYSPLFFHYKMIQQHYTYDDNMLPYVIYLINKNKIEKTPYLARKNLTWTFDNFVRHSVFFFRTLTSCDTKKITTTAYELKKIIQDTYSKLKERQ